MVRPQAVTFEVSSALIQFRTGGSATLGTPADAAHGRSAGRVSTTGGGRTGWRRTATPARTSPSSARSVGGPCGRTSGRGSRPCGAVAGSGRSSDVGDDVFSRTAVAGLADPEATLTCERLQALQAVRGATEAGIPFLRLRRPACRPPRPTDR